MGGGARLPDHAALQTYRWPMANGLRESEILLSNVTSGLIYAASSARDLNDPQIDQYWRRTRGSTEWTILNVSKFLN